VNQSNPDFELPEMPLPPEPPLEDDGPVTAIAWPAQQEFDTQPEAFRWAYYQTKAGGPRYKVQGLRNGKWEAIQAWMMVR
jgi:hypothetical protein